MCEPAQDFEFSLELQDLINDNIDIIEKTAESQNVLYLTGYQQAFSRFVGHVNQIAQTISDNSHILLPNSSFPSFYTQVLVKQSELESEEKFRELI